MPDPNPPTDIQPIPQESTPDLLTPPEPQRTPDQTARLTFMKGLRDLYPTALKDFTSPDGLQALVVKTLSQANQILVPRQTFILSEVGDCSVVYARELNDLPEDTDISKILNMLAGNLKLKDQSGKPLNSQVTDSSGQTSDVELYIIDLNNPQTVNRVKDTILREKTAQENAASQTQTFDPAARLEGFK